MIEWVGDWPFGSAEDDKDDWKMGEESPNETKIRYDKNEICIYLQLKILT